MRPSLPTCQSSFSGLNKMLQLRPVKFRNGFSILMDMLAGQKNTVDRVSADGVDLEVTLKRSVSVDSG